MTSSKQIKANQKNSKFSTGPRSAGGKAVSSRNSIRHGLTADTLLPWESKEGHEAFRKSIISELRPEGAIEEVLCEQVINAAWILTIRLPKAEAGVILNHCLLEAHEQAQVEAKCHTETVVVHDPFHSAAALLPVTETVITDEKKHDRAVEKINEIENLQREEAPLLGRAVTDAERFFSNFARYRGSIERTFFRSLHELQRIQAARRGEGVPPPAALDVDVTVSEADGN